MCGNNYLRYIVESHKNLLAMKDKTNVVSALCALIGWLAMPMIETLYYEVLTNKFTYGLLASVIIFYLHSQM